MPRSSASCGWISSRSSWCQAMLAVRRVWAPTLYWLRIRPVVRISGKRRVLRSSVGTNGVGTNLPRPRVNDSTCMIGVPCGASSSHGHWMLPTSSSLVERHSGERRCQRGDLVHDLARVVVVHGVAHRRGDLADDLPLVLAVLGLHHRAHPVDPPLGVGEGAVLLQERRAGQEHVGELRGLVEEQVLHDQQFHRAQGGRARAGRSGRTARCPRRGRTVPGTCPRSRRRTCSGSASPGSGRSVVPQRSSKMRRTASSDTCR